MENNLTQEQELIRFSNEIGFGSLPNKVSNHITKIRQTFAKVVNINEPYNVQMKKLYKALKENDIEFVNGDVFGDLDDTGVLRIEENLENPTTGNTICLLVDVLIGLQLHDTTGDDTEENTFIACTHYADVVIDDPTTCEETEIQDINGNILVKTIKGDNIHLQINNTVIDENAKSFVFDGCHKLYIIVTEDDKVKAKSYGYDEEIPIVELEDYWLKSCPLRFINYFNLDRDDSVILEQGADCPMFIYF